MPADSATHAVYTTALLLQNVPADTTAISAFVFGPAGLRGTLAHSQCPSDSCDSSALGSSSYAVSCSSLGPSYGGSSRAGAVASSEAGQLQQYGLAGGAGPLSHRMSSGRRFSRQGSRMRQTSSECYKIVMAMTANVADLRQAQVRGASGGSGYI
jgi:hypothetical protein